MEKTLTLEKGTKPARVQELPEPRKSPGRRLLRTAAKILAAIALLAVLAGAGALLWLRSDSGTERVASEVRKALAARGLKLEASSIRGPLPGSLTATDLVLSDSGGAFLRIAEAEARISLLPLLSRRLQVDLLRVAGVDFVRPPTLPPSPEENGGPMSVPPVDISARVEIENARVLSGADPVLAASVLNLRASAAFDREGPVLSWDVAGSWTGPEGRGVTFRTSHDPISRPDEPLSVDFHASAGPGSPLAAFAADLPFRDPELSVTGSGPLDAWEGDFLLSAFPLPPASADDSGAAPSDASGPDAPAPPLSPPAPAPAPDAAHPDDLTAPPLTRASLATAGRPSEPNSSAPGAVDGAAPGAPAPEGRDGPGRSEIRGHLLFSGSAGKTVKELLTAPDAPFTLRLEAGKDPDFPILGKFARHLGRTLRLAVAFDKDGRDLHGSARLFSEKGSLTLEPLKVSVTDGGLSAEGAGILEITDFGEFAAPAEAADASEAPGTPASDAAASEVPGTTSDNGRGTGDASGGSSATCGSDGAPGAPPLPQNTASPGGQSGGPAQHAEEPSPHPAAGTGARDAGGIDSEDIPDGRSVRTDAPGDPGGGTLGPYAVTAALRYSIELKGQNAYLNSFSVSGDGLNLDLSGSLVKASGWDGEAGADAAPASAAAGDEATAKLRLKLAPGSGFARMVHAALPSVTSGADIELGVDGGYLTGLNALKDVTVRARTGDLSAFLPVLGGDADLSVRASGPLDGNLSASADLTSERLLFASGRGDPDPVELSSPVLKIGGTLGDLADGPSFDGDVSLAAKGKIPGEKALRDATATGKLAFASGDGGLRFSARGLALSALGAELSADRLDVAFPPEGQPELSGALRISVTNWELPSK
ncbi:MAG: hypothetical protein LBQ79_14875, partial [Deltaproteobacteria bacterium]|nr:hypothetical protein [Deltaproteobacteria bacterium]